MRRTLNKTEREEYKRLTEEIEQAKAKIEELEKLVFGYARVSTKGQAKDGNSLDAQIAALRKAGAQKIYADKYTGTSVDRPELEKLLSDIRPGDTLIVTRLDRIARSTIQGLNLIQSLVEKEVKVHVLDMGVISKDTNSPEEQFRLTMILAFAEYEQRMIMQRTREGKEIARKKPGYRDGRPPKYTNEQRELALSLLGEYSYRQVSKMTGISRATIARLAHEAKN